MKKYRNHFNNGGSMKKILLATIAALAFASVAHADADPWDVGNVNTGAFRFGSAYFDTTIVVAAGGDSIAFGFWADRVIVSQGVWSDSGMITVKVASNAANNLGGGIRTGLDRVASNGIRLILNTGVAWPMSFYGNGNFSGLSLIPTLAVAGKTINVQAWRE